jgi:hypothetical protein
MAHIHIPKQSWDKLSTHSLPCTFLRFSHQCSAFHLIHCPHNIFLSLMMSYLIKGAQSCAMSTLSLNLTTLYPLLLPPLSPSFPTPNMSSLAVPPTPSCPKHITHPPIPDNDPHYSVSSYGPYTNITLAEAPEPKTYDKAMASSDAVE